MGEPTQRRPVPLTDQRTLSATMTLLRDHLPLTADGYRCQTDDLWRIVLAAAVRHATIEAVCADLLTAPHANTVRGYLTRQLTPPAIPALEAQTNTALATALPDWLSVRPQAVAVDFHDEPYYGRLTRRTRTIGSVGAKPRRAPPISTAVPPPTSCSAMCA